MSRTDSAEGLPRIDVLMPVYNGARYLAEQVDSILAQQGVDLRLIVLDDSSTDGSLRILRSYASRDSRVRIMCNDENMGLIRAIGRLLGVVDAPFFALSDQDDVWDADKLSRSVEFLAATEAALVYSDVRVVGESGEALVDSYLTSRKIRPIEGRQAVPFAFQNPAIGHTMVGRAATARGAAEIPPYLRFHEPWLVAVAANQGAVRFLDAQMGNYREHSTNVVGPSAARSIGSRLTRLLEPERREQRCATRAAALQAISTVDPDAVLLAEGYSNGRGLRTRLMVIARLLRLARVISLPAAFGEVVAWLWWRAEKR